MQANCKTKESPSSLPTGEEDAESDDGGLWERRISRKNMCNYNSVDYKFPSAYVSFAIETYINEQIHWITIS